MLVLFEHKLICRFTWQYPFMGGLETLTNPAGGSKLLCVLFEYSAVLDKGFPIHVHVFWEYTVGSVYTALVPTNDQFTIKNPYYSNKSRSKLLCIVPVEYF